jgi:hypothetical protein
MCLPDVHNIGKAVGRLATPRGGACPLAPDSPRIWGSLKGNLFGAGWGDELRREHVIRVLFAAWGMETQSLEWLKPGNRIIGVLIDDFTTQQFLGSYRVSFLPTVYRLDYSATVRTEDTAVRQRIRPSNTFRNDCVGFPPTVSQRECRGTTPALVRRLNQAWMLAMTLTLSLRSFEGLFYY